jgi:hypothetical protein
LQAPASIEDLEQQREELEILLGTSFLKGPFESYLTNHKDPQAIWTLRFHQAVEELQASKSDAPLAVFSKVAKVGVISAPQKREINAHACDYLHTLAMKKVWSRLILRFQIVDFPHVRPARRAL